MLLWWVMQDLDNETLNHVDAENRRQTLEEEIEFLKQVQEQVSWQVLEGHSGVWRLYSSWVVVGWLCGRTVVTCCYDTYEISVSRPTSIIKGQHVVNRWGESNKLGHIYWRDEPATDNSDGSVLFCSVLYFILHSKSWLRQQVVYYKL